MSTWGIHHAESLDEAGSFSIELTRQEPGFTGLGRASSGVFIQVVPTEDDRVDVETEDLVQSGTNVASRFIIFDVTDGFAFIVIENSGAPVNTAMVRMGSISLLRKSPRWRRELPSRAS